MQLSANPLHPQEGGTTRGMDAMAKPRSSLYWARWSCECPHGHTALLAVQHACSTSHHCYQEERFDRSLQEAC
jgi:hypothetical protein